VTDLLFPPGFLFGASTAAYQIEGVGSGRGESIWDTFARTEGKVTHGDNADIACDHYFRLDGDLDLVEWLGLGGYRFSVSWSRVIPDGFGPVNSRGLDFYKRMVDGLLARNVTPMATLYHWDLPQPLQDIGGWPNREVVGRFCDYADAVLDAIGDLVPMWITVNEPFCAGMIGYLQGRHAPGLRDPHSALAASHHLMLAHGQAMKLIRSAVPGATAGNSVLLSDICAATPSQADAEAARRLDGHENRWFLDPMLRGHYPADMLEWYAARVPIDFVRDGDMETIASPMDFSGINYYETKTVTADLDEPYHQARVLPAALQADVPLTANGIDARSAGLGRILRRLRDEYPKIPLYITENGAPFHDYIDPLGQVSDPERVCYLSRHLAEVRSAVAEGVDVRGYFVWSLLDNFEWADGYSRRFGLFFVEFGTQTRLAKSSATWYKQLVAEHAKLLT
jgi:beta-glucosidase